MIRKQLFIISFLFYSIESFTSGNSDSLLNIISSELEREFSYYKGKETNCYYLEYRIEEIRNWQIESSFGSIVSDVNDSIRIMSISARIGDYSLDNTHEVEEKGSIYTPYTITLPFENDKKAIQLFIWKATQNAIKDALNVYNQVLTSTNKKETEIKDFSKESVTIYYENIPYYQFKNKEWRKRLKKYTSQFAKNENIIRADAKLSFTTTRNYLVNSEGTQIVQNLSYAQLQIILVGKSETGNTPLVLSYYAFTPDSLPDDPLVESDIIRLTQVQETLRNAPQADAYAGPALLSPEAAAVFFHEIFGHRIEGHRLKYSFDSQTFKSQIGQKILPRFINIYSDPTLKYFNNKAMYGYYQYDNEGVKSQKVNIVEKGVLKNFLMSRTPISGFNKSNGHGRSQIGKMPVSRQSNLIIESNKTFNEKQLRKKLIAECKRQKKSYGLYFKEVVGGFTQTSRYSPNVFNVTPTVVYKVYTDGRPDELVKGVDFIGTPLAIFSDIIAMGNTQGVFTGYCGAESGSIPVTATAPAILVRKIETQKKPEVNSPNPILPRPNPEK